MVIQTKGRWVDAAYINLWAAITSNQVLTVFKGFSWVTAAGGRPWTPRSLIDAGPPRFCQCSQHWGCSRYQPSAMGRRCRLMTKS